MAVRKRFFAAIASLVACLAGAAASATTVETSAPHPFPALAYVDKEGGAHQVSPEGHPLTLVHFWASWCMPCLKELPELDAAAGAWKAKGINVIAISLDGGNRDTALQFMKDRQLQNLAFNLDAENAALSAAGLNMLPVTVFLNANGDEIARANGPVHWQDKDVRAAVEALLR